MAIRNAVVAGWLAVLLAVACGDDDDPRHNAGGSGGDSGAERDAGGRCDDRGCWVSLAEFQREVLRCAADYESALIEYAPDPDGECESAFFRCRGLDGAAYQYGFTGDNVQCYYDDGVLVGAVRTSDHGPSTLAGNVPAPGCYEGPDCPDAGGGEDGGRD